MEDEPDFEDLAWPENDLRHTPRAKDALYGVLRKSSSGTSVATTCWTIRSSILFTLGRSGERVRMSHSWPTCWEFVNRLRGGSRSRYNLHPLPNLASFPPVASFRSIPRFFVSKQRRRRSTSAPQPTRQAIVTFW